METPVSFAPSKIAVATGLGPRYKGNKEIEIGKLKEELDEFKTMVEKNQSSYEEILEKTTKSIERFIENAESDQEKNIQ